MIFTFFPIHSQSLDCLQPTQLKSNVNNPLKELRCVGGWSNVCYGAVTGNFDTSYQSKYRLRLGHVNNRQYWGTSNIHTPTRTALWGLKYRSDCASPRNPKLDCRPKSQKSVINYEWFQALLVFHIMYFKWTHIGKIMFIRLSAHLSPYLLDGFQLNLVLDVYAKCCSSNLILVRISPIKSQRISDRILFSQTQLVLKRNWAPH
jgi:hypothetical protein